MMKTLAACALLFVACFTAAGCTSSAPQESSGRPNIVLILTDDMRQDDIGYMPKTQSLIADEGMEFANAFVTTPTCCPSRASILRGQYAHNHEVLGNRPPLGGFDKFRELGDEESTVATWLADIGYRTSFFGKYLNAYNGREDATHVPQGWDEWYARAKNGYYDYGISENGSMVFYGSREQDYLTDVLTAKATDSIRNSAGSSEPLFMYLAPNAPHSPYENAPRHEDLFTQVEAPKPPSFNKEDVGDKPDNFLGDQSSDDEEDYSESDEADVSDDESSEEQSQRPRSSSDEEADIDETYRKRLRMLQAVDDMVEGVVDALAETGRLENTYIFFTSDNGFLLGEHGLVGKGAPYEEAIRVPLAVRGPSISAGSTTERIALNIDLAPTFAELAGASLPTFIDGRSLRPLFASDAATWRTAFLGEFWNKGDTKTYKAVRTASGVKYVEYEKGGKKELYNLNDDPYELESQHDTVDAALQNDMRELRKALHALEDCAGESCRTAELERFT